MDGAQVGSRSDFTARVSWVDTAKGFGVILVVFGHVLRGLVNSDLMEWTPYAAVCRHMDLRLSHAAFFLHLGSFFVAVGG